MNLPKDRSVYGGLQYRREVCEQPDYQVVLCLDVGVGLESSAAPPDDADPCNPPEYLAPRRMPGQAA